MPRIRLDTNCISADVKKLLEFLREEIKGQNRAIEALGSAFETFNSGLKNSEKPISTLLFLGPSGVGKTLAAEIMAKFFFGSQKDFTKIACADFTERHEIASLIGAPPGYVGFQESAEDITSPFPRLSQFNIDKFDYECQTRDYDKKKLDKETKGIVKQIKEINRQMKEAKNSGDESKFNQLNQKKRELLYKLYEFSGEAQAASYHPDKNYRSIVLFDEIEKAHPSLHNILLEIIDKGRLSMMDGRITRFNNSFIFLTSNVASREIADESSLDRKKIGFYSSRLARREDFQEKDQGIYNLAIDKAKEVFPPEFLGRLDKIIVFHPLSLEAMKEILDLQLKHLHTFFTANNFPILLSISPAVKDFIIREATDRPEFGARLLNAKIEKYIRQPLIRLKNCNFIKAGDVIVIELEKDANGKMEPVFYKDEGRGLFLPLQGIVSSTS